MKRTDVFLSISYVLKSTVFMVAVSLAWTVLCIDAAGQTMMPVSVTKTIEQIAVLDFGSGSQNTASQKLGILNLNSSLSSELSAFRVSRLLGETVVAAGDRKGEIKSKFKIPEEAMQPLPDHSVDQDIGPPKDQPSGFQWSSAFRQSMLFLSIQHAFRLATEDGTRADLDGPFFKDYFKALRSLRAWSDGDPFIVNYIGHPMMGSVSGFIQVFNDPKGINEEVGLKKSYWMSRLKALGWSTAYSTQFEIGLISEASLGNIGIRPYGKSKHPMSYVDLVVTPVVGTGWLVGEDALDRYLILPLEKKMPNRTTLVLVRSFLNPTRSFANMLRGKWFWYRDNRR